MFRNHTAIALMLFAALALTGCSSRQKDRLSESDYPYTGPPAEDNGGNGKYASTGQDASAARYATTRGRSYRAGGTDYYGQWAYSYGRDPSYDYYLASDDGYWDDDEYGYDYPEEVAYFYDELDPYGDWYEDARYGWVWAPEYVSVGWRPYLYGHWVYTDWGWAWVSDDPWGANTYHYGRWNCDASNRWFWIPDDVWGPAWVSWRYGDGWAGWAPLPPEAGWDVSFGLRYTSSFVDASRWCFVPESRLTSTRLRTYVAPLVETRRIYRETRDYTRYASVNGRAAERGLRPSLIERRTGRNIPEYRLETRESGLRRDMVRGRTLVSPMPVVSRGQGRGRTDRVTREMRVRQERFAREMRTNRGRLDREQVMRGRGSSDREQVQRERERTQGRGRDVREERVRRDRAVQEQHRLERRQEQQRGYERERQQRFERQQQRGYERERQQRFERQQQQRYERQQQERGRSEERRMQRQRSDAENGARVQQQARREEARQRAQQAQYRREEARQRAQQAQYRREEARQRAEQAQYQRREQARQQAEQAQYERQQRQQQQQQQQQRQARGRQQRQEPPQQDREQTDSDQRESDQRGHGRGRGHNR